MGRASKNRGPIGLNAGRLQETARSAGERKAPCSLAPWQLPPKASTAGGVPKPRHYQGNHPPPPGPTESGGTPRSATPSGGGNLRTGRSGTHDEATHHLNRPVRHERTTTSRKVRCDGFSMECASAQPCGSAKSSLHTEVSLHTAHLIAWVVGSASGSLSGVSVHCSDRITELPLTGHAPPANWPPSHSRSAAPPE